MRATNSISADEITKWSRTFQLTVVCLTGVRSGGCSFSLIPYSRPQRRYISPSWPPTAYFHRTATLEWDRMAGGGGEGGAGRGEGG